MSFVTVTVPELYSVPSSPINLAVAPDLKPVPVSVTFAGKAETFKDTWECHEYIAEHKIELLSPHIIAYGDTLKGFEFYCESRYGEEV